MQVGDFIYPDYADFDCYLSRAVAEPPGVFASVPSEQNAIVLREITGLVGRAVTLDVPFAVEQCGDHAPDSAGDQRGVSKAADAHR